MTCQLRKEESIHLVLAEDLILLCFHDAVNT